MEIYKIQLFETVAIIICYILLKLIFDKSVEKVAHRFEFQKPRLKIVKKIINFTLFLICIGIALFVWGVNQSELLFFISSLLTVLGIAFFAQWSIISNITSTLIIFFNYPAKIGDKIKVLDKDFLVEGTISDIGVFFIIINTKDKGKVTIPSNSFIQKMIHWENQENKN